MGVQHDITQLARRTARRLLSGAGSADVTAYHIDRWTAVFVAHTLLDDGRILVTCPPSDAAIAQVAAQTPVDVRLDVALDAAEPGVQITVASAHLLGSLEWLEADAAQRVLASAQTPACHCAITGENPLERLAEVAGLEGSRVGLIRTGRVVLHSPTGVSGHLMVELIDVEADEAAPLWSAVDDLVAHDGVAGVGLFGLHAICDAVQSGAVPGWVLSSRPTMGICPSLWGEVLCADVDGYGATLMQIGTDEVVTLLVAFPQGPVAAHEVGPLLDDLAATLLPERLARP